MKIGLVICMEENTKSETVHILKSGVGLVSSFYTSSPAMHVSNYYHYSVF